MPHPIFIPPTNQREAHILVHPTYTSQIIHIHRSKWYRWFQENISLPMFFCPPAIAQDVSEALYLAAVKAAQLTNKRNPGKHGGNPVPVGEDGMSLQIFRFDARFIIQLMNIPADDGGGIWILIPAHPALDIPSAVQFARVASQAAEMAGEMMKRAA